MLRYQIFASMLRTSALAVLLVVLPAGWANAQDLPSNPCFGSNNQATNLGALLQNTSACNVGTGSSYVSYTWTSFTCQSDPGSTCPTAGQITVSPNPSTTCSDDDGYSNDEVYTVFYVQSPTLPLNVTSSTDPPTGHYFEITINGTVTINGNSSGTHNNWNWPHFCGGNGQSQSGVEDNITHVYCGGPPNNCVSSLAGKSEVECNSMDRGEGVPEFVGA